MMRRSGIQPRPAPPAATERKTAAAGRAQDAGPKCGDEDAVPLEFRNVEVVLEGLEQKTDRKTTTPGKLRTAENIAFTKTGRLNKRRGYVRVGLTSDDEVFAIAPESLFLGVATFQDELVLFGAEYLYALADLDAAISGSRAIVQRGPVMRGGYSVQYVMSSSHGSESGEGPGL